MGEIYFSGRKLLAEQLEAWCTKNGAEQCALNYVTALDSLGGLDVDKCSEIIGTEGGEAMGVKTVLICDTCQAEKSFAAPYNIIKIAMKEAGWHNVNVGTQERPEWKIRCPGCGK